MKFLTSKKLNIDKKVNLIEQLSNKDTLLKNFQSLLQIVKQNRYCMENTLNF